MRVDRLAALWIATFAILTGLACGSRPAGGELGSAESQRAARAGIAWMIDHAGQLPKGWAWPFLLRLHRVVPDEALAEQIRAALRKDALEGEHASIDVDLSAPGALAPRQLIPVLFELERRLQLGLPYAEMAKQIEERIAENEAGLWKGVQPTQRAVYLQLFDELGIETTRSFSDLVVALRRNSKRRDGELLAADGRYVYGLTHLVIGRSRYYRQYPDPSGLRFSVPLLKAALQHLLELPANSETRDLQGEVLSSLQLLRVPDDEAMREARSTLLQAQNEDGSWGERPALDRTKVHLTFNAIMATLEYREVMRTDPER